MVKVAMAEEGEVRNEEKQAKGGEEYRRTGGAASHGTSEVRALRDWSKRSVTQQ